VPPFDLTKLSNEELVKLHEHKNEWWPRMARRVLAERFASGADYSEFSIQLKKSFEKSTVLCKSCGRYGRSTW